MPGVQGHDQERFNWLVTRVAVNTELAVAERLGRHGVDSYAPRYQQQVPCRRTHRKRFITRALFPCYLFVKTNSFYWLLSVEGIFHVVMSGGEPARSSALDETIACLKLSEKNGFVPCPTVERKSRFSLGARVRVLQGILRDRVGVVSRASEGVAVVDMTLLGRHCPVTYNEVDLATA